MRRPIRIVLGLCLAPIALAIGVGLGDRLMRTAQAESGNRPAQAAARVMPALRRELAARHLPWGAPIFVRIFKREAELELWMRGGDGRFVHFRTWPICTYSGTLGPKTRQGDNQAPEGFYRVGPQQLNPASRFHLAFNLGYPNAYDRMHGYSGDFLMVHGNCVSIGCYAMGDAGIEEIYTLADAALRGGQSAFDVHAFPFRLDAAALARERTSPWHDFWEELKTGYDAFERTHVPPRVSAVRAHYVVSES